MAKKKAVETVEGKKSILVDEALFITTRDALITSWMRLDGSIRDAVHAYIDHSNAVLGGTEAIDHKTLNVMNWMASTAMPSVSAAPAPAATIKDEDGKPVRKKRTNPPKDPNAPKRPVTAYLLYLDEMRPVIQAELGEGQSRGDISVEGTRRWKQLTDAEQQVFKDKYKQHYQGYLKTMAEYKAKGGVVSPEPAAAPEEADEADVEDEVVDKPTAASTKRDLDDDDDSSSDSSSDTDSDDSEEEAPPKEPTPPPVKTPTKKKPGPKPKAKAAPAPAAPAPASSPPLAPASSAKKANGTFTALNGVAKESSPAKRKSKAESPEEPKAKKSKKDKEKDAAAAAAAAAVVETPKTATAKKEKKARKSVGGEA